MPLKRKKRVTKLENNRTSYPELTLDQALDYVISGKRSENVRDRTLRDYRKMWGYFTDWLHDNYEVTYISELTTDMFRNYVNYMKYDKRKYEGHKYINPDNQGVGLADTTININLRSLKATVNFLCREEVMEFNPLDRVKLLKQDIDLTNCLTDEEVKDILRVPNIREFVGFRDYVAINILLDCGLRSVELIHLTAKDIDFKSRFITVSGEVSKSRRARLVPASSQTIKLILQLLSENRAHFKTDRLFLSSFGEPLGQNQFNKRLKYYAEKALIADKKVTAHVYRHTWAKNMILSGCDPFTLQKIGGWSDIRTMRRYIQMDIDDMRNSHDSISPLKRYRNTN